MPKSSVQSQYFCPEPTKGRHSHIFCAFACQILHTVFPQKNSPPPGCGGGNFHGGAVGRRHPRRPGPSALLLLLKIIHCTDKAGVVLEGCGLQLQSLGEGGHDAFAHLRGQRVYQKRLLRADAAADQDQLRVEDVYKARKALGDLVDPAVEHSQRAGVARGGSLKNRTPAVVAA